MVTARIPNNWKPRASQRPLWDYLEGGGTRAIELAHRRWGKDDVALHRCAVAALERPATYWHCLPEYEQGRRSLWTAVNARTGKRRIDEAFPEIIRAGKDEQAMMIKLVNGSTWQVIGSDRYNALVGAGVAGVTFSEWALCNPASWGYISPMLRENNGWAVFITTPRGKNHAHTMYNQFKSDPDWFAEISTVLDTGAFNEDELAKIRQEYVALYGDAFGNAQYEQEYMCSFDAAILGSYYGGELAAARGDGRVCRVEYDDTLPVTTVWDIGYTDDTAIRPDTGG
jgi:phage terminase large subunit